MAIIIELLLGAKQNGSSFQRVSMKLMFYVCFADEVPGQRFLCFVFKNKKEEELGIKARFLWENAEICLPKEKFTA